MTLTSNIKLQVRDLDFQAMGGGGDSTEKTYHQTVYESDLSKGNNEVLQ